MSASGKSELSVEDIIFTLKNSSLPTVIVEGKDDLIAYRKLEEAFANLNLSVLPVGGRKKVLELYERRGELPTSIKIGFVADKDTWVFTGVPGQYTSPLVVFTNGYSIENDLFLDGNVVQLMDRAEQSNFDKELNVILKWYALAIFRLMAGHTAKIDLHPNHLIDDRAQFQALTELKEGEQYPDAILERLRMEYAMLLRGKLLMSLALRQLSHAKRNARHNNGALLEQAVLRGGPNLRRIFFDVGAIFGSTPTWPS